jgi:hypothetical protein
LTSVHEKVSELSGQPSSGNVWFLGQLRFGGLYFSPLNLYYVFDEQDQWRWLLAEVSNTPWFERHYYLIDAQQLQQNSPHTHDKAFHVSPFNPVDQQYQWRTTLPNHSMHLQLVVQQSHKVFEAQMQLKKQPIRARSYWKLLGKLPWYSLKVLGQIYYHAWLLWRKKTPFHPHPNQQNKGS